jgi:uncharacterized membrane protein YeaQ/YmgE (transglycosylase-associated protein family)
MKEPSLIMSLMPMATIYAIASAIAISRHAGEQTRSQGFRRWRRMHLWIAGAFGAAFILGYVDWTLLRPQWDPAPLLALVGTYFVPCLITTCIAAPLLSVLNRSQGFWRQTLLWVAGAFGAAIILGYMERRPPGDSASLLSRVGGYLVLCLLVICIAAPLHSFLRSRKARKAEHVTPGAEPQLPWPDDRQRG